MFSSSHTCPPIPPPATLLKVKPAHNSLGRRRGSDSREQTSPVFLSFFFLFTFHFPSFVSSPVIRLCCNEAVDEPDDNYVLKMSSAPSVGKLLFFPPFLLLRSFSIAARLWRRRLVIAQITPRRAWLRAGTCRLCAGHASQSRRFCRSGSEKSAADVSRSLYSNAQVGVPRSQLHISATGLSVRFLLKVTLLWSCDIKGAKLQAATCRWRTRLMECCDFCLANDFTITNHRLLCFEGSTNHFFMLF